MRCIIKCNFQFSGKPPKSGRSNLVLRFVKSLPWDSPFLDHHEIVAPKLRALLDEFPSHQSYLEESNLKTIYVPANETWGIITEATIGETLDIRLSNKQVEHLKQACEEVISEFVKAASSRKYRSLFLLKFPIIQILDRESDVPVYVGEVVQHHPFRVAIREQKLESAIGVFSLALSTILLYLSSPVGRPLLGTSFPEDWSNWFYANISQLSVATLATASVSILKILLHALDLRRMRPIRWRLSEPS